ncbi:MAG: class I SAM-dependent methyltransferase [Thermoflexales bacterium]
MSALPTTLQRQWRRLQRWLDFNRWYVRGSPPWDHGIPAPEVIAFAESHAPGRALDLGCGTGTHAIALAQRGWTVTGVDFAWPALRQAARKARAAGVRITWLWDDVTRLREVRGHFDLILDIGCFFSLDAADKQRYAQRVRELLAKGGTLLLYVHWRRPPHAFGLLEDELRVFDFLQLTRRTDSVDVVTGKASAWLAYQNGT